MNYRGRRVSERGNRRLSPRRLAFAKEYVRLGNGTVAAKNAGYSENSAYNEANRLLKNDDVVAEIQRIRAKTERANTVTRAYVIAGLQDIAENGKTESNRVRALELLGKTIRLFVDRIETHTTLDTSQLQEFTLEELLAIRESLRALPEPIEDKVRLLDN